MYKLNSSNLQPAVASNSRCFDACTFLIFLRNKFAKAAGFVASVRYIASAGHSTHHGSREGNFIRN